MLSSSNDDIPQHLMIMEREAGAPEHVPQVAVGFGPIPVEDPEKTAEAGHPVFKEVEFVKIAVPGDRQSLYMQPATDRDRQRFPRAYAAFKSRESNTLEGMPIEQWPQVTRALAMTLRAMNIHTVEALAEVHDGNLGNLGQQGRELRAKAAAFLKQAKDAASSQRLAAENAGLKDQIATLQQQFEHLAARVGIDPEEVRAAIAGQSKGKTKPADKAPTKGKRGSRGKGKAAAA